MATAYERLTDSLPAKWDRVKADTFFRELNARIADMPKMQTDKGKELMQRFFDAEAELINSFAEEAAKL